MTPLLCALCRPLEAWEPWESLAADMQRCGYTSSTPGGLAACDNLLLTTSRETTWLWIQCSLLNTRKLHVSISDKAMNILHPRRSSMLHMAVQHLQRNHGAGTGLLSLSSPPLIVDPIQHTSVINDRNSQNGHI